MNTREELTRQAEKCLRQGRIDDAIAQYQELASLPPIDWGVVKQLADLLERAGQREAASAQFCRWADHLFAEGFHSKAAALYKKVLKLEAAHEHALWHLGEVSLALKLKADARVAFQRALELRQRRNDTAGVAAARERLDALDLAPAGPPTPGRAWTAVPAAPDVVSAAPMTAAETDATSAGRPDATAAKAAESPAAASPLPDPAPLPPSETPEARLARLRREAEAADALQAPDAAARWQAVLEADPRDVATRLRLVQRACDRGDLDAAAGLADPLDTSNDAALVARVEVAYRRGQSGVLADLVSDRVHARALPAHVLAPVHALAARQPGAARAALSAAVSAWQASGQPGHAVAALADAHERGLLDTVLHLRWVEICVDTGAAGLSRAQHALARMYLDADRAGEARAVAEDLFVREGGAEPYRALLLEVLDREGAPDPHRVLVDLLTPPSEVVDEAALDLRPTHVLATPPSPIVLEDVVISLDDLDADGGDATGSDDCTPPLADAADVSPAGVSGPSYAAPRFASPDDSSLVAEAEFLGARRQDVAPADEHGAAFETWLAEPDASSPSAPTLPAGGTSPNVDFDWAALLGRDLEGGALTQGADDADAGDEVALAEPSQSTSVIEDTSFPAPTAVATAPVAAPLEALLEDVVSTGLHDRQHALPEPPDHVGAPDHAAPGVGSQVLPDTDDVIARGVADIPEAPAMIGADVPATREVGAGTEHPDERATPPPVVPSASAEDTHDPYDTAKSADPLLSRIAQAQPMLAAEAPPLPPGLAVSSVWLSDAPVPPPPDKRQRRPEDAYLYEDDETVPSWMRWRAAARPASPPASPPAPAQPQAIDPADRGPDAGGPEPEAASPVDDSPAEVAVVGAPAAASPTTEESPQVLVEHDDASNDDHAPIDEGTPPDSEQVEFVPERPGAAPDLVEEEVDLTQLLEELRQFDTVLPDPRPRVHARDASPIAPPSDSEPPFPMFAPVTAPLQDAHGEAFAAGDSRGDEAGPEPLIAAGDGTAELDAVFADVQRHTDDRTVADQQLAAGRVFLAAGLVSEAARAFERASQEPRSRFAAAQAIAELHRSRGQLQEAVGWYEQAAMAPVQDAAVKRAVLYDLAESLEALGETDRALGVLLDLLSQVEDYRDARARLDRLLRVDAGG